MSIIVFDLEWNQCPQGRGKQVPGLPFEIIEIGAVKLNSKMEMVDEFDRLICPEVYYPLHSHVRKVLTYSIDDLMRYGTPFSDACEEFLDFAGDSPTFVTWGPGDLTELQRNMAFFHVKYRFPKPLFYWDAQRLFAIQYLGGEDGKRLSLSDAVDWLGLTESEGRFHRAISDARYTADVLTCIDLDRFGIYKSVDLYKIPRRKEDEYHLLFGESEEYVSRGFATHRHAMENPDLRLPKCFLCGESGKDGDRKDRTGQDGQAMQPVINWFTVNQGRAFGLFSCPQHGLFQGEIHINQSDSGRYYGVRILKQTNEAGAKKIEARKTALEAKKARRAERLAAARAQEVEQREAARQKGRSHKKEQKNK